MANNNAHLRIKDKSLSAQEKLKKRQDSLKARIRGDCSELFSCSQLDVPGVSNKNCENLVGSVAIPVGVAGPAQVEFNFDDSINNKPEDFQANILLPLATTEGALVASVSRGCKLFQKQNCLKVYVHKAGMSRAPVFGFSSHAKALSFKKWLQKNDVFRKIKQSCEETSSHLRLNKYRVWLVGRVAFVRFVFDTDQAMGMNMVTLALEHVWQNFISQNFQVRLISLSGNMCADKKQTAINRLLGRGYSVQAEIRLTTSRLKKHLRVSARQLKTVHDWKNVIGSTLAGATSRNMHAANMVAATFLATGQDIAHVVEASQASLTMELSHDELESLYVSLRMPNVNLGVVGGGTYLPAFSQARSVILGRNIKAEELAGVVATAVVAGELSGLAALVSHSLAKAHRDLGREVEHEG